MDVQMIIRKVKARHHRINEMHRTAPQAERDQLHSSLTIQEALALVEAVTVQQQRVELLVQEFRLVQGRPGKVNIHIAGDGEGGEFSETELAKTVREFYAKWF